MQFGSHEWVSAMDDALTTALEAPETGQLLSDVDLVLEYRIAGGLDHHVVVAAGGGVVEGRHPAPDVVFSCDVETAAAIASGACGAHDAVLRGTLQVGGDMRALRERSALLVELDDVFAAVRSSMGPAD